MLKGFQYVKVLLLYSRNICAPIYDDFSTHALSDHLYL